MKGETGAYSWVFHNFQQGSEITYMFVGGVIPAAFLWALYIFLRRGAPGFRTRKVAKSALVIAGIIALEVYMYRWLALETYYSVYYKQGGEIAFMMKFPERHVSFSSQEIISIKIVTGPKRYDRRLIFGFEDGSSYRSPTMLEPVLDDIATVISKGTSVPLERIHID